MENGKTAILNLVENGKTAILNLVENGKMYKNTAVIIAFISCEFLLNLVFLTLETILFRLLYIVLSCELLSNLVSLTLETTKPK